MTLKVFIRDGQGTGLLGKVLATGEIVVGTIGDNIVVFNTLNVIDTAFNFFIPLSGFNFFITSVLTSTPGGTSNIDIYEASSPTTITIDKQLVRIGASGKQFIPINFSFGGFIKASAGSFINAKTDNQPVDLTIIGYYASIT